MSGRELAGLRLDEATETTRIIRRIRQYVAAAKRKGVVVAVSGGIDSSVVAALCVRALGRERVLALQLPERESSDESLALSTELTNALGVDSVVEDITPVLRATGCYQRRDDAIRMVIPEYGPGWKSKIVLPNITESASLRLFWVVAEAPDGVQRRARLTAAAYLEILAASNFKQRTRKMLEYYHADRLNYVVAGTPNRLEYDQGFFVKLGDGAADFKPVAHLYKTQVYALAEFLEVPAGIRMRQPTTDTYSMPQSQEEFYFSLPYQLMDVCLYGVNNGWDPSRIADATGLTVPQVERVIADIEQKRRATAYLHAPPMLIEEVPEIRQLDGDK